MSCPPRFSGCSVTSPADARWPSAAVPSPDVTTGRSLLGSTSRCTSARAQPDDFASKSNAARLDVRGIGGTPDRHELPLAGSFDLRWLHSQVLVPKGPVS